MSIKNIGTELPSGIERAIRDSLALDEEVIISRDSKLVDLDSSFDSLDVMDILFKVEVNPRTIVMESY